MAEKTQISDVQLVRLLGEYATKADAVHQRYSLWRGWLVATATAVLFLSVGISLVVTDYGALNWLVVTPVFLFVLITSLTSPDYSASPS